MHLNQCVTHHHKMNQKLPDLSLLDDEIDQRGGRNNSEISKDVENYFRFLELPSLVTIYSTKYFFLY